MTTEAIGVFHRRHSATVRRRSAIAAALACLPVAAAAGTESPSGVGAEGSAGEQSGVVAVELNRTESVPGGCRMSFVIRNRTDHAFESMQWDLVLFDPHGLIVTRTAVEAAPLPAGKTSVKLFDVPDLACEDLGRVLLNNVMRCETGAGGDTPVDCMGLTVPSSRVGIELFK